MKPKLRTTGFITAAILSVAFSATSCDDIAVPAQQKEDLRRLYPDASRIDWDVEGGYTTVNFRRNSLRAEAEAWFDHSGTWQMTVTEIGYLGLPQAVRAAFEKSNYARWRVDDVDMVERRNAETVYVISIEQNDYDHDLYYTADGRLVKDHTTDMDTTPRQDYLPKVLPTAIETFMAQRYPGARIVETDTDYGTIEIDILDRNIYREVTFDLQGKWLYTKTSVAFTTVPEPFMTAFRNSTWASYRVDDIKLIDTPSESYYLFELDTEPSDIYVKVTATNVVRQ